MSASFAARLAAGALLLLSAAAAAGEPTTTRRVIVDGTALDVPVAYLHRHGAGFKSATDAPPTVRQLPMLARLPGLMPAKRPASPPAKTADDPDHVSILLGRDTDAPIDREWARIDAHHARLREGYCLLESDVPGMDRFAPCGSRIRNGVVLTPRAERIGSEILVPADGAARQVVARCLTLTAKQATCVIALVADGTLLRLVVDRSRLAGHADIAAAAVRLIAGFRNAAAADPSGIVATEMTTTEGAPSAPGEPSDD